MTPAGASCVWAGCPGAVQSGPLQPRSFARCPCAATLSALQAQSHFLEKREPKCELTQGLGQCVTFNKRDYSIRQIANKWGVMECPRLLDPRPLCDSSPQERAAAQCPHLGAGRWRCISTHVSWPQASLCSLPSSGNSDSVLWWQ